MVKTDRLHLQPRPGNRCDLRDQRCVLDDRPVLLPGPARQPHPVDDPVRVPRWHLLGQLTVTHMSSTQLQGPPGTRTGGLLVPAGWGQWPWGRAAAKQTLTADQPDAVAAI